MRVGLLGAPGGAGAPLGALLADVLGAGPIPVEEARGGSWPGLDALVVAGGRVGAEVQAFVARGGAVLGVGPGLAALCAAGLLPGEVTAPAPGREGPVHLRVEGRPTPFTAAIPAGRVLRLPGAGAAARWTCAGAEALAARGRIVLRYCDEAGGAGPAADPTGSTLAVGGVCDEAGQVVGIAPLLPAEGDGRQLLESLRLWLARGR